MTWQEDAQKRYEQEKLDREEMSRQQLIEASRRQVGDLKPSKRVPEGQPLKLTTLSLELDLLKESMFSQGWNSSEFQKQKTELEARLFVYDLGLLWQDSEECYMVYSLKSVKE